MWADPPEDPPGPGNSWLPLIGALALAIVMLAIVVGPIPAIVALGILLVIATVIVSRRRRRTGEM